MREVRRLDVAGIRFFMTQEEVIRRIRRGREVPNRQAAGRRLCKVVRVRYHACWGDREGSCNECGCRLGRVRLGETARFAYRRLHRVHQYGQ
jgi:hypothetical protein